MLARLSSALFLALVISALAEASPATTTVPFQLIDNRMVVQATVDGVPGFAMIVDTGAYGVMVTPGVAEKLHLSQRGGGTINGAGSGRLAIENARLNDIAVGDYDLGKQKVIVGDLGAIQRGIGFLHLDGIIGFDMIGSHFVRVDVDRSLLTISRAPFPVPSGAQSVPLTSPDGFFRVNVKIDGVPGNVILDTGDRSSFTIFKAFAEHNGFYDVTPAVRNALTGFGIGGPIHSDVIRTHLDVFGFSIPKVVTRVPLGNAGIFTASPLAGSIGNGVLTRFNTIYDGIHHTLTVWPSNRFAVVEHYDPLGMWLAQGEHTPVIADITPGGPAYRAGLHTGDSVLALNGRSTQGWIIPDIRSWIAQQQNGSSISIDVESPSGSRTTRTATISDPFAGDHSTSVPR